MTARVAIGFGATTSARVEDVVRLIEATLSAESAVGPTRSLLLATIEGRADLARDVGAALGCAFVTFDAATLARVAGIVTASPQALARVGTASVAEAAALAALASRGRLVTARTTGRNCTCAVAKSF
ncbi:MAG: hypothetical protein NVSMB19_02160 [Vulcanimicrobiaceae bacterium]